MKTYSIMETQHNLARVLRVVESGQEVGITRRKQLVARLLPVQAPLEIPDFVERARRIFEKGWSGSPSDSLLSDSRGDR